MRSTSALSGLRRTRAAWLWALSLVVLAALPFTAPFASLNWSDFVGGGRTQQIVTSVGAPLASNAQDDDADDAAASDACVQRAHSFRFCEFAPVTSAVAGLPSPPVVSALSLLGPSLSARGPSVPVTVLRL
jgi:hypothetical protein